MKGSFKGLSKELRVQLVICGVVLICMISLLVYATYTYYTSEKALEEAQEVSEEVTIRGIPHLTAGVCSVWPCYIPDRLEVDKLDVELSTSTELPSKTEEVEEELPDYFEYLCQCVEAEAGDQDFLGKCYVVDCILNRVDSKQFPNSVVEVINQKRTKSNGKTTWQFEVVMNGRINRVKVSDETREAVKEELKERKNYEILYFCMFKFTWAEFLFKHGDHYFHK